jgi:phage regulator Rha-like protein
MESITNQVEIENKIYTLRGVQIMLDTDLAVLFNVETKNLNKAVKRNEERFPNNYRFQLTENEWDNLRFQFGTSSEVHGGRRYLPYVFTEQGVAMLSAVLRSEIAVKVSIQIIDAFVEMRKQLGATNLIDLRLSNIERKQLEADQKFEQVFKALEKSDNEPQQGVFFEGQIFDAYTFVADVIRSAKNSVILIDNYIDDTVLTLLAKRNKNVTAIIYTQKNDKQLQLDLKKHNQQYPEIKIHSLANVHDRFLLIDEKELYHIGASLKDLGKKWFAFSKMNDFTEEILKRIQL